MKTKVNPEVLDWNLGYLCELMVFNIQLDKHINTHAIVCTDIHAHISPLCPPRGSGSHPSTNEHT